MASSDGERDVVWQVVRPTRPSRLPGVEMAGFRDRGMVPEGHRLLPHPAVTLALDFGANPLLVDDTSGRQHRGSLAAGVGLPGATWVHGENLRCVQVRLSPVIAGAALGVRLSELDKSMISLEELWGRDSARITERLHAASDWQRRFALIDALLLRRHRAAAPVDREVAWAWRRITTTRGRVRVEGLAEELGWSRKRLWSRFGAQIGLPPKRAAKLVRFDHAVHRLATGQDAARVAAAAGYLDQSHLHRDVREFTGITPTAVSTEPFLAVDEVAWDGS